MRISKRRTKNVSSTVVKMVMALAFTSVIGGISTGPAAPAFGDDNGRHLGQRHWQQEHDRYYERERPEFRSEYRPEYRPEYRSEYRPEYRPYVYAPPPVVYAPYPSPGISLFFDFR